MNKPRIPLLVFLALLLGFLPLCVRAQNGEAAKNGEDEKVPEIDCIACHPNQNIVAATKHGATNDQRTPFANGRCIVCHSANPDHQSDPTRNPMPIRYGSKRDPELKNQMCLSCHQTGNRLHWQSSAHDRAKVACVDCHTVHAERDRVRLKQTQAAVCFGCHKEQRAQMFRMSSHPMRTGQMNCSSCHNPHGSSGDKQLIKNTINETCYTCHADKRGPFLWEHPPARENCLNCHSAHGSNHSYMLVRHGPFLCQSCHMGPFPHVRRAYSGLNLPPNAAADKMLGMNCSNCHIQVHGSNHPSGAPLTR